MTQGAATARLGGAGDLCTDTPVVVLNTHHSGLAIARDLGPLGIRVIGLTAIRSFPGNASRWLEYRAAPDSLAQPDELFDYLLKLGDELGVRAILLPTRDHDVNLLARHSSALAARFLMPMLPGADLDRVMNKDTLASVATEVGLNVPRAVTVSRPAELERASSLRFPCICKPVYASQWRKPDIWEAVGRQKALRVASFEELGAFYAGFSELDPLIVVQEWVEGGEKNLQVFGSYCSTDHDVVAFFTARKRLQYPPLSGTGIVVEALRLPELEGPSRALLRRLKFHGISEIEYKRDERSGRLYLIEINPRHWDQHGLGTVVGVNLSEALYRDATRQPARAMVQREEHSLWVAEAEFVRHAARCVTGRAPWRDIALLFGASRTWSVFDRNDYGPIASLVGLSTAKAKT